LNPPPHTKFLGTPLIHGSDGACPSKAQRDRKMQRGCKILTWATDSDMCGQREHKWK